MHQSSLEEMKKFFASYSPFSPPLRVLDVGSRSLNPGPTYRDIIPEGWVYIGLDAEKGPNVDVVTEAVYRYPFFSNNFDVVISGQVLEHVLNPNSWVSEIYRVCGVRGKVCIIAPTTGKIHSRPDYWRITQDGMQGILERAGFNSIHVHVNNHRPWCDCVGVGVK